jgi:hypothetical protein
MRANAQEPDEVIMVIGWADLQRKAKGEMIRERSYLRMPGQEARYGRSARS